MEQLTSIKTNTLLMRDLENAAIYLNKRHYFLYRALNKYVSFNQLRAIAFIRFSPLLKQNYEIIYVGPDKDSFTKWIEPLIADTVDMTLMNIANSKAKQALQTNKLSSYERGIIISWPAQHTNFDQALEQLLYEGLKAISYVEQKEYEYFYEIGTPFEADISKSIQAKDTDGLLELLSLTKSMTESDITFWGETDSRQVEVDMHIGSKQDDFGFLLPVGEGIGGLAAKNKKVLQVADYQNCAYRYEDVSSTVDGEKIRSVFALPLKDNNRNTSGILYVGNRTINPLPLEKKFLLLRLGHQLEPIVKRKEINQFFTTVEKDTFYNYQKSTLREIGQTARSFTEMEDWLANLLQGVVHIVDSTYKFDRHEKEKLNELRYKKRYTYPLTNKEKNIGTLHIWTNIELPLTTDWPDLIDDVIYTCFIIHERNERYFHLAELERSQWLYNLLQAKPHLESLYDKGVKLHLPVDRGEVWAFHINKTEDSLSLEEKIKLEEVTLDCFRQPIYFTGNTGFIIFDYETKCTPEKLRNSLLTILPVETWLIHGASYTSFTELQNLLTKIQSLLKRATQQETKQYLLTFDHFGLDNLLNNPRITKELQSFAKQMLQPIIQYDKENNSELTKTLALSLVHKSPSVVAKKLYIHPNTVHYRVNRAKQLLQIDLGEARNEIALAFAAYTWLFEQNIKIDE